MISAIAGGLASLKTGSDLVTRLREALTREIKLDEVLARIIEIQAHISDGRTALIDAQEDHQKLVAEITLLRDRKELENSVVFHHDAYWKKDSLGEQGPFCPSCWDLKKDLVRPMLDGSGNGKAWLYCTVHNPHRHFQIPIGLYEDRR